MKAIHPLALFRLSVLGPVVSREPLARGELQSFLHELAPREYAIPGSRGADRREDPPGLVLRLAADGIEGLVPKRRADRGLSRIPARRPGGAAGGQARQPAPARSASSSACSKPPASWPARRLSRSAMHRLLQHHGLSRLAGQPPAGGTSPLCRRVRQRHLVRRRDARPARAR